jgi:hypothetical protein
MTISIRGIWEKYNNPGLYGYMSDEEIIRLYKSIENAVELTRDLDAGNACMFYFTTMQNTIYGIINARKIDPIKWDENWKTT